MSKQELAQLKALLARFRDERDSDIAASIAKASSNDLAIKLRNHGGENLDKVDFTIRWVAVMERSTT